MGQASLAFRHPATDDRSSVEPAAERASVMDPRLRRSSRQPTTAPRADEPSAGAHFACSQAPLFALRRHMAPARGYDRTADLGRDSSSLEPIVHVEEALLATQFLLCFVLPIRQRFLELIRRVDLFFGDVVECVLFGDLVCDEDEPADRA